MLASWVLIVSSKVATEVFKDSTVVAVLVDVATKLKFDICFFQRNRFKYQKHSQQINIADIVDKGSPTQKKNRVYLGIAQIAI